MSGSDSVFAVSRGGVTPHRDANERLGGVGDDRVGPPGEQALLGQLVHERGSLEVLVVGRGRPRPGGLQYDHDDVAPPAVAGRHEPRVRRQSTRFHPGLDLRRGKPADGHVHYGVAREGVAGPRRARQRREGEDDERHEARDHGGRAPQARPSCRIGRSPGGQTPAARDQAGDDGRTEDRVEQRDPGQDVVQDLDLRGYDLSDLAERRERVDGEAPAQRRPRGLVEEMRARGQRHHENRRQVEEYDNDDARYPAPHGGKEPDPQQGVTQVEQDVRPDLIQERQRPRHVELAENPCNLKSDVVDEEGHEQAQRVDPVLPCQEGSNPPKYAVLGLFRHDECAKV